MAHGPNTDWLSSPKTRTQNYTKNRNQIEFLRLTPIGSDHVYAVPDTGKMTASVRVGPHLGTGHHNEQETVEHPGRYDS